MNAWIETEIRRNPAQYLWVHKRFKTRPEGEAELVLNASPFPDGARQWARCKGLRRSAAAPLARIIGP